MLTAKLKDNIINCYDGAHSRETLKTWAGKGILLCPVCGKPYEYCHGRIVPPYFRHKDKEECLYEYYEPETEEHIKGKIALYKWAKKQEGVTDVVLEGWIPETKQRPDVMFKYNGKQYVLEYQCSPLSTHYLERHELYRAAGVKDIWILGSQKYNLEVSETGITHSKHYKTIEKYARFYWDTNKNEVYYDGQKLRNALNLQLYCPPEYTSYKLSDLVISDSGNTIIPRCAKVDDMMERDSRFIHEKEKKDEVVKHTKEMFNSLVARLNGLCEEQDWFALGRRDSNKYIASLYFQLPQFFTFFFHHNSCDCCTSREYPKVIGRGKRGGPRWGHGYKYTLVHQLEYEDGFDFNKVFSFIKNITIEAITDKTNELNNTRNLKRRIVTYYNKPIRLLFAKDKKVNYPFRFKFVRGVYVDSYEYISNNFIPCLNQLDKLGVDKYVLMIADSIYYDHAVVGQLRERGFDDVKIIDETWGGE